MNGVARYCMKKLDLQSWASEACLIDWVHWEKNHGKTMLQALAGHTDF